MKAILRLGCLALVALATSGNGLAAQSVGNGEIAYTMEKVDGGASSIYASASAGGPERLLVRDGSYPAWTPNGSRLTFALSGAIWTSDPSGGKRKLLLKGPGGNPATFAWSPDGSKLAFSDFPATNHNDQDIYVVSADGTTVKRLTRIYRRGDIDPTWSPDSKTIMFTRGNGTGGMSIWTISSDGKNQRQIAADGGRPSWSPDGTRIVFQRSDLNIWTMRPDGSSPRRLTNFKQLLPKISAARAPAWSPDGTLITFVTEELGGKGSQLYVMNANGTSPKVVTQNSHYYRHDPAWQPVR